MPSYTDLNVARACTDVLAEWLRRDYNNMVAMAKDETQDDYAVACEVSYLMQHIGIVAGRMADLVPVRIVEYCARTLNDAIRDKTWTETPDVSPEEAERSLRQSLLIMSNLLAFKSGIEKALDL